MTATSNPFVENRRGFIADIWERSVGRLYVMDDRGLRLLLHESELVPDGRDFDIALLRTFIDSAMAGRAQGFRRDSLHEALRRLA